MVSLINNYNKQGNQKSEKTKQTQIWLVVYFDFSLFHEKVKLILWSIRTFWYKGFLEKQWKMTSLKKGFYSEKTVVRIKKLFFIKGSTNRWIWHLYNVFRNERSIQVQPIIPNLINQRKLEERIRILFDISRIFFIYIYIYIYVGWLVSSWPVAQCPSQTDLSARLGRVTGHTWLLGTNYGFGYFDKVEISSIE